MSSSARAEAAAPAPLAGAGQGEASAPAAATGATSDALDAWRAALVAWLDAHRIYPESARLRGEQGAVGVRFSLAPSGDVKEADVQRGSGSETLDDAALSMLRGAHLPAPPAGMDAQRLTVSVSIRYSLN